MRWSDEAVEGPHEHGDMRESSAAHDGSRIALRSILATRYHDSFAERLPGLRHARRTHHRTAPVHFRSTLSKNAVARAIASAVAVAFAGLS